MANCGGDAGKRNQNLHLHDGHSYDIDHHDHYSGYVHDVKLGLAIKFLFDKNQNVGYRSAKKSFVHVGNSISSSLPNILRWFISLELLGPTTQLGSCLRLFDSRSILYINQP